MAFASLEVIKEAGIEDREIRYLWDDWKSQGERPLDDELVGRMQAISQRAVLALMGGAAEWIVCRFAGLFEDPAPLVYLEAAWAMHVDVRYCGYGGIWWQEYVKDGWEGPVKGPIGRALDRREIAIQQLAWEYEDPSLLAGLLSNLTAYVMTDPAPFTDWQEKTLERLESLYPRDPADELGDVVPREAIEPGYDFRLEQTEGLISSYLNSLDHRVNRFLSDPARMVATDYSGGHFPGTPYAFDIELDRQARREL